jgi:hypothetical protein
MKIELTNQESETYFHNALCNGLIYISDYGLELSYDETDYTAAKERLNLTVVRPEGEFIYITTGVCYEDVLMEILKGGGKLKLVDNEGGEDDAVITLQDVHERVSKTQMNHLMNMINEEDDAVTADVILQTVFLNDIVYG